MTGTLEPTTPDAGREERPMFPAPSVFEGLGSPEEPSPFPTRDESE
jgi:hypothetical protein